ncbi:MAG: hypothetical protein KAZ26_20700, partial [Caldilineaceae bacterium]|nr:hypothetical protein [Caldilineaceae bacterium]
QVVSAGDVLSEAITRHNLGQVVAPGDVAGVAAALLAVLDRPRSAYASNMTALAAHFRWDHVTAPLSAFCRDPQSAPDRAYLAGLDDSFALRTPWHGLPSKAWRAMRHQGASGLARQMRDYVRWRITSP